MMLYSGRQRSIFIIIGLICVNRIITDFCKKHGNNLEIKNIESAMERLLVISIILCFIIIDIYFVFERRNDNFIDDNTYPVEMSEYILEYFKNSEFSNVRIFNEYNYGSYLLYRGIPVFIDSRADLYSPEFNENVNIFEDCEYVGMFKLDIDEFVEKYNITHIILKNDSALNVLLEKIKGDKYRLIKQDDNFSFYEITENL